MDLNLRFRINTPKVVFEAFEDEVVLVNFDTGNYYSLRGSAVALLNYIQENKNVREIINDLDAQFVTTRAELEKSVVVFLDELCRENIVVAGSDSSRMDKTPASGPNPSFQKIPFQAPTIERYADMQELILLDPIHEVDESGWPKPKNGRDAPSE
jgi:hypothetical protein